ncbi:MAG: Coq4 family protein [Pyrinomonadaceae bacterium]
MNDAAVQVTVDDAVRTIPGETVRAGRDRYLKNNSLTLDSYTESGFPIYVGKSFIRLPNPGLLHLHDLHHVVTGYGTGLVGEAEISAYELRAGCRSFMVHLLCVGAILCAMFVAPRRIVRAWRRARGARTLYYTTIPYETLLDMSVAELRRRLNITTHCASDGRTERL